MDRDIRPQAPGTVLTLESTWPVPVSARLTRPRLIPRLRSTNQRRAIPMTVCQQHLAQGHVSSPELPSLRRAPVARRARPAGRSIGLGVAAVVAIVLEAVLLFAAVELQLGGFEGQPGRLQAPDPAPITAREPDSQIVSAATPRLVGTPEPLPSQAKRR
jgi:hypothetical protein